MSTPGDTPRSRGMMMIAAYRADRLNQRPLLRKGLQQARSTLRQARHLGGTDPATEAAGASASADQGPDGSRSAARDAMADSRPSPQAVGTQRSPEAGDRGSVFADLVSVAVIETQGAFPPLNSNAPDDTVIAGLPGLPAPQPPAASVTRPDLPESAVQPNAESAVRELSQKNCSASILSRQDVSLAELGFGPGMLIRLRQLGLHSIDDLSRASATELRTALGDISRLIDVERWIIDAQRLSNESASMTF